MARRAAAVSSAAVLIPLAVPLAVPLALPGAAADRAARVRSDTVALSVQSVAPTTLPTTARSEELTVTVRLANHGSRDYRGVRIEAQRGEPETSQAQLQTAQAHQGEPSGHVVPVPARHPVKVDDLPAGATVDVVFTTTTSTLSSAGLCNCTNPDLPYFIYPLYFSAHVTGPGGVDQRLGLTNTFVSAFYKAPAPDRVSWVWPLIDQPHLLNDTPTGTGGPVFADDLLVGSVSSGGRLDRALAVLEAVARSPVRVPVTVLVDPELLAELEVMATGHYQVRQGPNRFAPGAGKDFAAAWLQRLASVLDAAPQLVLQLTPYADPDVDSLQAAGLKWQTRLPDALQQAVDRALGVHSTSSTLAWPASGKLSRGTLNALVGAGVSTVLLDAASVAPKPAAGTITPGLARLSARGRDVAGALLDPTLQGYVKRAIEPGGDGAPVLPLLMSQLAVRAVQEPTLEHVVVLAPPRWVDPDVGLAAQLIVDTSRSLFARPVSLGDAVAGDLLPSARSRLVPSSGGPGLPSLNLSAADQIRQDLPALRGLLTPAPPQTIPASARQVLEELPLQGQRATSSAWSRPGQALTGANFAGELSDQLSRLTNGVTIINSTGSYTLASENSKLPVTVRNNLPWPVRILVQVTPVKGLAGFQATPQTKVVDGGQKATIKLPTSVVRNGRFEIVAALYTIDGRHQVGEPVTMTVNSTGLDLVGVIIMIVSGTVLAIALIVRFGRRIRRRWSRNEVDAARSRWAAKSEAAESGAAEDDAAAPESLPAERAP